MQTIHKAQHACQSKTWQNYNKYHDNCLHSHSIFCSYVSDKVTTIPQRMQSAAISMQAQAIKAQWCTCFQSQYRTRQPSSKSAQYFWAKQQVLALAYKEKASASIVVVGQATLPRQTRLSDRYLKMPAAILWHYEGCIQLFPIIHWHR